MQETIEFRIPEEDAREFLDHGDGVCIGGSVRKIELSLSDPRFARIGQIERAFRAKGDAFFTAWIPHRRYTNAELEAGQGFQIIIKRVFEPAGEECGTIYDESNACQYCGSGERQVSDLILEARSLPKRGALGFAKTIAGEVVVSEIFVEVFRTNKLRGAEFGAIKQSKNPSLNIPGWYQIFSKSEPLRIVAPTRTGITPFDDGSDQMPSERPATILDQLEINGSWCDREGDYRCPLGHTIGLNLLSELSVNKSDFNDWDIAFTRERLGVRRGVLRPEPLLVISPRLRHLLLQHGLRGMNFEIVHLKLSEHT